MRRREAGIPIHQLTVTDSFGGFAFASLLDDALGFVPECLKITEAGTKRCFQV